MPPALPNPFMIEPAPKQIRDSEAIPLILIHDGGGTIISYTMLNPMKRAVYGIHNPRFYDGGAWEGGISEMTDHYTRLVKGIVPSGGLLIGGWSLGGILAVQIAHNLARDGEARRKVLGLVMIDSPCPLTWSSPRKTVAGSPTFSASTGEENRARVRECMRQAGLMLQGWKLPQWRHDPKDASASGSTRYAPPPSVLIRCREFVPTPEGSDTDAVARVDIARESRTLGWDTYWESQGFDDVDVLETDGHHYNLFAAEYLDCASSQILKACNILLRDREA